MFCKKCGKYVQPNEKVCPYCGEEIIKNTEDVSNQKEDFGETKIFGNLDIDDSNGPEELAEIPDEIEYVEDEEIDLLFRTNVFGPVKLMNLCLPKMREDNSGIIINVSSIGKLNKRQSITTIDVDNIYNLPISPSVYPRIFAIDIDCAFFSIMILDSR